MQGELIIAFAVHLLLVGLPGVAAALVAARAGVRAVPVILAIALAATGVLAMLGFWAYYADLLVGESVAYLVAFGSVGACAWALWGGAVERELLGRLAVPLALWALGSAFLVFLGFDHGGIDVATQLSGSRFSHPLPSDNYLPAFYTEWFSEPGHSGPPPIFDPQWHFSDRPPLQVGYMLLNRGILWDDRLLACQVTGVLLQQLWIVGLWALLLAARLGGRTRALVIGVVLVSDVAIVNGFFVWPKLLPAAMLLAAAALAITTEWSWARRSLPAAALIAALLTLAMLGHGSSVFGAIPIALIAAYRGLPSWRWIAVAIAVALVLFLPWVAYQKFADPPGDRLVKWMVAGVMDVDDRGAGEAIVDSYRDVGLGGAIHAKGQNFVMMVGGKGAWETLEEGVDALGEGDVTDFVRALRFIFFFYLLPAFGLFLVAPVVMALRRETGRASPAEWRFALSCFWAVGLGALFWGLILFGNVPSRASIHIGTLLLPILGFAGAVAGLRAAAPRFALYYVPIAAALTLALYVPVLDPLPGTSFAPLLAALSAAALAGFLAVAWTAAPEPARDGAEAPPSPG